MTEHQKACLITNLALLHEETEYMKELLNENDFDEIERRLRHMQTGLAYALKSFNPEPTKFKQVFDN